MGLSHARAPRFSAQLPLFGRYRLSRSARSPRHDDLRRLAYHVSGVRCLNLEITRSGGARQRKILLIGAHYDTVAGCPGANDNTSGVSALLELSRLFTSVEPALTVRFVAFVNEEQPFSR